MNRGYLPAIITYLAGFIACLLCILNHREVNESLVIVLVTLVVYYVVGTIAKAIIDSTLSKEEGISAKKHEFEIIPFNQDVLGESTQDNELSSDNTKDIS